jgi:hypothetical protein
LQDSASFIWGDAFHYCAISASPKKLVVYESLLSYLMT